MFATSYETNVAATIKFEPSFQHVILGTPRPSPDLDYSGVILFLIYRQIENPCLFFLFISANIRLICSLKFLL